MAGGAVSSLSRSKAGSNTQELEVNLLDGKFSSQQAKAHVLGILTKSIQHHWVQSFKHHEDSAESDVYSDTKMAELSKLREDFLLMLNKAEENGLSLDIEASLKVKVVSGNNSEKIAS